MCDLGPTRRIPNPRRQLAAFVLLLALVPGPWCFGAAPPNDPMRASAPITVLQRLVRHFDFEEAERSPVPMPTHFYRVGQEQSETAQGFPLFGQMGPRRDLAYTGRWSFGFELAGGSMAARIPTGVLPVMPGSDYRAAVKVRTSGLHHARARLIAWLHDRSGAAIEASRVTSPPLVSEDHWETLAVDVPGDFPSATGLIVELQLAQPRLFRGASLAENEPVSEDYAGRVWFDDLKVWLLPRLEMSSGAPGNVFVDPDPPTLFLLVNDLISERLLARLRVHDLDGHTVVDRRLELEHGERPLRIDLPALPFGWYRSSVELLEQEASVGHRTVDFAYVPAPEPRPATKHTSFGVELSSFSPIEERLVSILGVGSAVIPVGVISEAERDANSTPQERGHALDACLATGMELILEVDATAEQVVQRLGAAPRERVSAEQDAAWLQEMLLRYGQHIQRWQIGLTAEGLVDARPPDSGSFIEAARALDRYVPNLQLIRPWPATWQPPMAPEVECNLVVGPDLAGHSMLDLASLGSGASGAAANAAVVSLLPPTAERLGRRAQVLEMIHRTLYAWRGQPDLLVVPAPWSISPERAAVPTPLPTFSVWRQLVERLAGRRFAGMLPGAEGIHAWLIQGEEADDTALVAWSEQPSEHPVVLSMLLADGPVVSIDPFGNSRLITPTRRTHEIPLTALPVFIEGIDVHLARFRTGFRLDPDFVPTAHRLHEHQLVLTNPWPVPITGTMRVVSDEQWRITPRAHRFTISPGDEARFPVTIVPDRRMTAGVKTIEAEFELNATHPYQFRSQTTVRTGHPEIDLHTTWHTQPNLQTGRSDLVLDVRIGNIGERPLRLSVFLHTALASPDRRTIGRLEPGEVTTQTFRIDDGFDKLVGTPIYVGVDDRDDAGRAIEEVVLEQGDLDP